jgi:phosphate transport system permease protein
MNAVPPVSAIAGSKRSARFHQWRSRKDRIVRRLVSIGGISVISAVVLIFFYLLYVVFPLFLPASTNLEHLADNPRWQTDQSVYLSVEEQRVVGLRVSGSGEVEFFSVFDGSLLQAYQLPLETNSRIKAISEAVEFNGLVAVASDSGQVVAFKHSYQTRFDGGVESRKVIPELSFPYGEQALLTLSESDISSIAVSDSDTELVLAATGADGQVRVEILSKTENFLSGDITLERKSATTTVGFKATAVAISGNHHWLYLGDDQGNIHRLKLDTLEQLQSVHQGDYPVTTMSMLLGGISVLVGDSGGSISQLFPVRGQDNEYRLQLIRRFDKQDAPIIRILPEQRRKGFLALDAENGLGIYHSTAKRLVHFQSLDSLHVQSLALSPRANGLLIEGGGGSLNMLEIKNRHPEISFSSLWRKVWYENYDQPEYVWQSSASSNEFEPKFSLTPLVFGTLKAALYAMLFAIPLALMGAAYTAYFMSPALRNWVKPGIEVMAALPTVILGFMAGLWFAPYVEENLAGIFMILLVVPVGLLVFAWLWHLYSGPLKAWVPEGWEPVLQLPMLVGLGMLAMWLADPVQGLFFGGDFRSWLSHEAGIPYDQRNALVVGCAMGFAVIPTIFSIAEDAIFGVPESLSDGSLALGATPWQTLVRVVLPTASPGVFSGLMIGLGRAVGETMIVLMATGNTPIMDWNLFEGMRTLAANIAVEMPESEVNGSHYRILFVAALVLFLFTFVVNTGAEVIRQRLRDKYSSL